MHTFQGSSMKIVHDICNQTRMSGNSTNPNFTTVWCCEQQKLILVLWAAAHEQLEIVLHFKSHRPNRVDITKCQYWRCHSFLQYKRNNLSKVLIVHFSGRAAIDRQLLSRTPWHQPLSICCTSYRWFTVFAEHQGDTYHEWVLKELDSITYHITRLEGAGGERSFALIYVNRCSIPLAHAYTICWINA